MVDGSNAVDVERFSLLSVRTGEVSGSYVVLVEDTLGEQHKAELEFDGDELVIEARNRRAPTAAERWALADDYTRDYIDGRALADQRAAHECLHRYGTVSPC